MTRLIWSTVLFALLAAGVCTGCRFLQGLGEATGDAPATPEARKAAQQADDAFWQWWNLLFGGAGAVTGAAVENRRQRRKQNGTMEAAKRLRDELDRMYRELAMRSSRIQELEKAAAPKAQA